jgi:predicted GTPase
MPRRTAQIQTQTKSDEQDIIIALMGETGSGKSSFIQRVTGSDSVKIGHSLHSG